VRGSRLISALVVLALVVLSSCAAASGNNTSRSASSASASRKVPQGFVGMGADGPIFGPSVDLNQQMAKMVSGGVERVRAEFNWNIAQPYKTWSDVPADERSLFTRGQPGKVPTNFNYTDTIVTAAAKNHLSLLPVVIFAPHWDARPTGNHFQPEHDAPYGRYLTALVKRYGPHGTFWSSNPSLPYTPIKSWQIWNEPNLSYYWDTDKPSFAPSYVALLRVAHRAIKAVDPSAQVVLGSLVNYGWKGLALIYQVHGARSLFDAVSSNPYTLKPSGVITILSYMRKAMDKHGDQAKPLIATEVGWPSAKGKTKQNFGFNTTEKGQAQKLSQLLPLLASNRKALGLQSFYYYTWMSDDQRGAVSWSFSGLLQWTGSKVRAKPAYFAWRKAALKLEGCTKKATPFHCG
jgi:hypothetical protein